MTSSELIKNVFYRWFNQLAIIGRKRELNEDDIYAVTNGMQSARNTDAFAKEWQNELEKKDPSLVRVIFRLYGFKALSLTFLYAVGSTISGYLYYIIEEILGKIKKIFLILILILA